MALSISALFYETCQHLHWQRELVYVILFIYISADKELDHSAKESII